MRQLLFRSILVIGLFLIAACEGTSTPEPQQIVVSPAATVNTDAVVETAIAGSAKVTNELSTTVAGALEELASLNDSIIALEQASSVTRVPPTATPIPTAVPDQTSQVVPSAAPTVTPPLPSATPAPVPTVQPTRIPTAPSPTPSSADLIASIRNAVVKISDSQSNGSGWIFSVEDDSAYVATNSHILSVWINPDVEDDPAVTVEGIGTYSGEVIGRDDVLDLAVVRICCSDQFHALEFATDSEIRIGDDVTALGYPLGSDSIKITRGVVSGFNIDEARSRHEVQTDAALNPGNSGGPLVSSSGEVAGMNTYKIVSSSGVSVDSTGFATGVETLIPELSRLKHTVTTVEDVFLEMPSKIQSLATDTQTPITGTVERIAELSKNSYMELSFGIQNWRPDAAVSRFHTSWGVAFRATDMGRYVFVSTTRTSWQLYLEKDGNKTLVDQSSSERGKEQLEGSGIHPLADSFSLLVKGDEGKLFVPGSSTISLDLSEHGDVGQTYLVFGYLEGDEPLGRIDHSFEAWRIAPIKALTNERLFSSEIVDYQGAKISGRYLATASFETPLAVNSDSTWKIGFCISTLAGEQVASTGCTFGVNATISKEKNASKEIWLSRYSENNTSDLVVAPYALSSDEHIIKMLRFEVWAFEPQ